MGSIGKDEADFQGATMIPIDRIKMLESHGAKLGDFDGVGRTVSHADPVILLDQGVFIYGHVTYITERHGTMIVLATYRRTRGTIIKRWKKRSYLKPWERVTPPRRFFSRGRIVEFSPPEL